MKKCAVLLPVFFILLFLFGCGGPADAPSPTADMPHQTESETMMWHQEGFAVPGEPEDDQVLWAGQYLTVTHTDRSTDAGVEELSCLDFGVCGDVFWYLCTNREKTGRGAGAEYFLELYDVVSGESAIRRFSPSQIGLTGENGFFESMDMPDQEHCVFRWLDYEQDEKGMYRQTQDKMVYADSAGDFQAVDFREIYLEKGIDRVEEPTELPLVKSIDWCSDGKGNICVVSHKDDGSFQICLFEQSGELLLEQEESEAAFSAGPLRTSAGELIFPVYDDREKSYEFLWADVEEKQMRSLLRTDTPFPNIRQMYGMLGNDIYYRSQESEVDEVVRWDVISGRQEKVFDLRSAGLGAGYEMMLGLREGQTPVLYLSKYREGKRKEWLTVLQEQQPADSGAVRVADLVTSGESKSQIEASVVAASMENPAYYYEYEDASAQENRDRILAELSQGKGPDMLFVSLEDMRLLEEKGLLLDIGKLIPEELREEILPGALEIGTVDGRLLGIPAAIWADTFAVAEDTWPEAGWRLEDIIELMEEGKLTCAIRNSPDYMMGRYTDPLLTVMCLVNNSLEDSFLIDWENRECHFDDERFIRLLELCNTDLSGISTDTDVWLNEGADILWGNFRNESNFLDFFAHMESENGRIVGYPTEGEQGSYLAAEGVLVVNINIGEADAAACFLETMLGKEIQSRATSLALVMSVRRLSPEDYIVEESGRFLFMGSHTSEVPVFEDGSTALHRAKDFLEGCTAAPLRYSRITAILREEISAMYAEGKSARTVAQQINSRIQLYLDEGN